MSFLQGIDPSFAGLRKKVAQVFFHIANNVAFAQCDSPAFELLIDEMGSQHMSRGDLYRLFDDVVWAVERKRAEDLMKVDAIAVDCDGWKSHDNRQGYLGGVAHYIDHEWCKRYGDVFCLVLLQRVLKARVVVSTEPCFFIPTAEFAQTGELISELIKNELKEGGLFKDEVVLTMVVTDNGSNFTNAATMVNGRATSRSVGLSFFCFCFFFVNLLARSVKSCVCHTLQLVVKDAREGEAGSKLRDLIEATHKMQTAVRKNKRLVALIEQQQLKQGVNAGRLLFPQLNNETRWHSDLHMLESAVALLPIYTASKDQNPGAVCL